MIQQATRMTTEQMSAAEYNRQQAMLVRGRIRPAAGYLAAQPKSAHAQPFHLQPAQPKAVHAITVRTTLHPQFVARRRDTGRSLAHHALGTLLVLGALVLMANA